MSLGFFLCYSWFDKLRMLVVEMLDRFWCLTRSEGLF